MFKKKQDRPPKDYSKWMAKEPSQPEIPSPPEEPNSNRNTSVTVVSNATSSKVPPPEVLVSSASMSFNPSAGIVEQHPAPRLPATNQTSEQIAILTLTRLLLPLLRRILYRNRRTAARLHYQSTMSVNGEPVPSYKKGKIVEIIKRCSKSSLSTWPHEALGYLLKGAHIRFCHPGEIILHRNEPAWATGIILVLAGKVRLVGKAKSIDTEGPMMLTDDNVLTDTPAACKMIASDPTNFVDCVLINYNHFWHTYFTVLTEADQEHTRRDINSKRLRAMGRKRAHEGDSLTHAINIMEASVRANSASENPPPRQSIIDASRRLLSVSTHPSKSNSGPLTSSQSRLVDDVISGSWMLNSIATSLYSPSSSNEVVLAGHFKKLLLGALEPVVYFPGDVVPYGETAYAATMSPPIQMSHHCAGSHATHKPSDQNSRSLSSGSMSDSIIGALHSVPPSASPSSHRSPPPLLYFSKGSPEIAIRRGFTCNLNELSTPYISTRERQPLRHTSSGYAQLPATFILPPRACVGEWSFAFNEPSAYSISVPRYYPDLAATVPSDPSSRNSRPAVTPNQNQKQILGDMITSFTRRNRWAGAVISIESLDSDEGEEDPSLLQPSICECWMLTQSRFVEVMRTLQLVALTLVPNCFQSLSTSLCDVATHARNKSGLFDAQDVAKMLQSPQHRQLGAVVKESLTVASAVGCAALKGVLTGAMMRNQWLKTRMSTVNTRHQLQPLANLIAHCLYDSFASSSERRTALEITDSSPRIGVFGYAPKVNNNGTSSTPTTPTTSIIRSTTTTNNNGDHDIGSSDVFPLLTQNISNQLCATSNFGSSSEKRDFNAAVTHWARKKSVSKDQVEAQLILSNCLFIDALLTEILCSPISFDTEYYVRATSLPSRSTVEGAGGGGVAMILRGCVRSEEVLCEATGSIKLEEGDCVLIEQISPTATKRLTLTTLTATDVCYIPYACMERATKSVLTTLTNALTNPHHNEAIFGSSSMALDDSVLVPVSRHSDVLQHLDAWYVGSIFFGLTSVASRVSSSQQPHRPVSQMNHLMGSSSGRTSNASFDSSFFDVDKYVNDSSIVGVVLASFQQALHQHFTTPAQKQQIAPLIEGLQSTNYSQHAEIPHIIALLAPEPFTAPPTAIHNINSQPSPLLALLDTCCSAPPRACTLHDFIPCTQDGSGFNRLPLASRVRKGLQLLQADASDGSFLMDSESGDAFEAATSTTSSRTPSVPQSKRESANNNTGRAGGGAGGVGGSNVGYYESPSMNGNHATNQSNKIPTPPSANPPSAAFARTNSSTDDPDTCMRIAKFPSPPMPPCDDASSPFSKTTSGKATGRRNFRREYPNTAGPTATFIHDRATEDTSPSVSSVIKAPSKNSSLSQSMLRSGTNPPKKGGSDAEDLVRCDTMTRPMTTGSAVYVYYPDPSDDGDGSSTSVLSPVTTALVGHRMSRPTLLSTTVMQEEYVQSQHVNRPSLLAPRTPGGGSPSSRPITPGRTLNPSIVDRTDYGISATLKNRQQGFLLRNRGSARDRQKSILEEIAGDGDGEAGLGGYTRKRADHPQVADEAIAFFKKKDPLTQPGSGGGNGGYDDQGRPQTAETMSSSGRFGGGGGYLQKEHITTQDAIWTLDDNDNLLSRIGGGGSAISTALDTPSGGKGVYDGLLGANGMFIDDPLGQYYYLDEEYDDDFGFGGTGAGGMHQHQPSGHQSTGLTTMLVLVQVMSSSIEIKEASVSKALQNVNAQGSEKIVWKAVMKPIHTTAPTSATKTHELTLTASDDLALNSAVPAFLRIGRIHEAQKRNVVLTTSPGTLEGSHWTTNAASFIARLPMRGDSTGSERGTPLPPVSDRQVLVFELWRHSDAEKYGKAEKSNAIPPSEFVIATAETELDPKDISTGTRKLDIFITTTSGSDGAVISKDRIGTITVSMMVGSGGSNPVDDAANSSSDPSSQQRGGSSGSGRPPTPQSLSPPAPSSGGGGAPRSLRNRAYSTSQQHRRSSTRPGLNDTVTSGIEVTLHALGGLPPSGLTRSRGNSFRRVVSNMSSSSIDPLNTTASGTTTAVATTPHRFSHAGTLRRQLRSPSPGMRPGSAKGGAGSSSPPLLSSPLNSPRRIGSASSSPIQRSPRVGGFDEERLSSHSTTNRKKRQQSDLLEMAKDKFPGDVSSQRKWIKAAKVQTQALLKDEWEALEAIRISIFPDSLLRKKQSTELLLITTTACHGLPAAVDFNDVGEEEEVTPSPTALIAIPQLRRQIAPPVQDVPSGEDAALHGTCFRDAIKKPGVIYTGYQQECIIQLLTQALESSSSCTSSIDPSPMTEKNLLLHQEQVQSLRTILQCGIATHNDTLIPQQFVGAQHGTNSPKFTAVSIATSHGEDGEEGSAFLPVMGFDINNADVLELTKWGLSSTFNGNNTFGGGDPDRSGSPPGFPANNKFPQSRPGTGNFLGGRPGTGVLNRDSRRQQWYEKLSACGGQIAAREVSVAASYKFFVCANPRKAQSLSSRFPIFICIHQTAPSSRLTAMLPPTQADAAQCAKASSYFSGAAPVSSARISKPYTMPPKPLNYLTTKSKSELGDKNVRSITQLAAAQSRDNILRVLNVPGQSLLTEFPSPQSGGPFTSSDEIKKRIEVNSNAIEVLIPTITADEELVAVGRIQLATLLMQDRGWMTVHADVGGATERKSPTSSPPSRSLEPPTMMIPTAPSSTSSDPSISVYYVLLRSIRLSLAVVFPSHLSPSGVGNADSHPSFTHTKPYLHLFVRVVGCEGLQNKDAAGVSGTARVKAFLNSQVRMKCNSALTYETSTKSAAEQLLPVARNERVVRRSEVLRDQTFLFQTSIKEETSNPVWENVHEGSAVLEIPLDEILDIMASVEGGGGSVGGKPTLLGSFKSPSSTVLDNASLPYVPSVEAIEINQKPCALRPRSAKPPVGALPVTRNVDCMASFFTHGVPTIAFEAWDEDPTLGAIGRVYGSSQAEDGEDGGDAFESTLGYDKSQILTQHEREAGTREMEAFMRRGDLGDESGSLIVDDSSDSDVVDSLDGSPNTAYSEDEDDDIEEGEWALDRIGCVSVSLIAVLRAALQTANTSNLASSLSDNNNSLPEQLQTVVTLPLYGKASVKPILEIGTTTTHGREYPQNDFIEVASLGGHQEETVVGVVTLSLGVLRVQHSF